MLQPDKSPTSWVPAFLALSLIWGSSFALIKVALDGGATPAYISLYRCAFGALMLWLLVAITRSPVIRDRRVWLHSFALGLLWNTIPFVLIAFGETEITSVLTGVLNATTPFFTLVFSIALLRSETVSPLRLFSLAIGFIGVMITLGIWQTADVQWVGAGAVMLASACYGLGFVYVRSRFSGRIESAASLSAAQITCATLQLAVLAPVLSGAPVWPGWAAFWSVLSIGALGTGVAYILNYRVVRSAGQTVASTVTYMATLVATVVGIVLLNEHVQWNTLLGAAMIIFGLLLNTVFSRRTKVALATQP